MRRVCLLFLLVVLLISPSESFDFLWTASTGEWSNSGNWRHLNISLEIQDASDWPEEVPSAGDDVFLINAGSQDISQTGGNDLVRTLMIGGDTSEILLRVSGSLTIGATSTEAVCSKTRVSGVGSVNGSNSNPNYIFLETKDQLGYSPGQDGPTFTLSMTALNNTQFVNPDFNYTITSYNDGVYLVTYFVSRRVTQGALLYINCNGVLVPGSPYFITFIEVPPPTISNAFFQTSGTSILVNFSIPTDRAGYTGHFDCANILDPTALTPRVTVAQWIGEGGYCYFQTNRILVVQLGNNAMPYVGDTIGILGGKLSGIAPFATQPGDPTNSDIKAPTQPLDSPMPQISAPRYVSPCSETVVLDTSGSLGTGGREWEQGVAWKLLSTTAPGATAIQNALDAANKASIVELPTSLFTPGIDYEFSVYVINFMQKTANTSAVIQVLEEDNFEIDIKGGPKLWVRVDQQVSLVAEIANPCNFSIIDFSFEWTGLNNVSSDYIEARTTLGSQKNLWIAANSLDIDEDYIFMVNYTATFADGHQLWTVDTIEMAVDMYGPIYSIVVAGDRQIDKSSSFVLDPTTSLDVTGSLESFEYKWDCTRNSFPYTGLRCFYKQDLFLSSVRLNIDSGVLLAGQYLFSLVVYKGSGNETRSSSQTVVVQVIDSESVSITYGVPYVAIESLGTPFISVHEPFRIRGEVTGENVANWTYTFDPPVDLSDAYVLEDDFGLIIPANTFQTGIYYSVTLKAYNDIGYGSSTVVLIAHAPAAGGRCRATPTTLSDSSINLLPYHVFCTQWETFHGEDARTFEFGYVSPLTGRDVILTMEPSLWSSADISVPYGTGTILVNIWAAGGQTVNRVELQIDTPPLTVSKDPTTEVLPIVTNWAAAYASFGSQEQVIHATMSALEWINCQGLIVEADNYTYCSWNEPLIYTDTTYESANRVVRQQAMQNIVQLDIEYASSYSVRTLAEIYASGTTPSSATDQNLIYTSQTFPFKWMEHLPYLTLGDQTVEALWEGVWNQLMSQLNFVYTPGQHVPFGQALTDLISYTHMGIQNGMFSKQPARSHAWKDVNSIMVRDLTENMASYQTLTLMNATVDLGTEVITRYTSLSTEEFAWGLVVLFQNTFLYEESSEGIKSALIHIQVVEPEDQSLFEIEDLTTPIRFQLPALPMWNPFNREVLPDTECVYWDSSIPAWSLSGMNYNITDSTDVKWCTSSHLSQFAVRNDLGTFSAPDTNQDPGFGWWIFAGVLSFLLVGIIILTILLFRRRHQEAKEKELEAFMGPSVVNVVRENME